MKIKDLHPRSLKSWAEFMLPVFLLLMLFGWPFLQESEISEQVFEGVFLLLILSAVAASSVRSITYIPILTFGVLALVLDTASSDASPSLERLAIIFDLFFSLTLSVVLLA